MQNSQRGCLYSASDLVAFMGCRHRSALDLRKLGGWDGQRSQADAASQLVQDYGDRHERDYLAKLKSRGLGVVEINKSASIDDQVQATRDAMAAGTDVIFQAALLQPPFLGYADFLVRVEGASNLGKHHYEVVDTKLAKSNRSKFMVQLCFYADLVAAEQGVLPRLLHVVLGQLDARQRLERGLAVDADNTIKLPTRDYIHYVRAVQAEFLRFVGGEVETHAVPVPACQQCGWREHCQQGWEQEDHLSRVANVRASQIAKLERAGVKTMHALARLEGAVDGIGPQVLTRLKRQAELQCNPVDANGQQRIELLSNPDDDDKPRGFQLLPEPSAGDLYFDMEGFPHEPGGLEYLYGVGYFDAGDRSRWKFKAFWAHNRVEEKRAFEQFMDFVEAHLSVFPDAHLYHYAPYERTAIKNLSSVHSTRDALRDRLLREGRLVDLYRVVISGLLLALPSYSIKKVESYYRGKRQGEVANAGDSIVQYEAYRVADDAQVKARLLGDIERYNRDDVESTQQLHDWLEGLRPAGTARFKQAVGGGDEAAVEPSRHSEREVREARAKQALAAWSNDQPESERAVAARWAEILGQLLGFYWRCKLPTLWRVFERKEKEEHELLDDSDCLAMLVSTGAPLPEKRSIRYHYTVPQQESKVFDGASVTCLTDGESASSFSYDDERGLASFTRGATKPAPPRTLTLCLSDDVSTDSKLDAIYRFIHRLCSGRVSQQALLNLLDRQLPVIRGHAPGAPIVGDATVTSVLAAIRAMDSTHLVIQGPPGTGKTTTAAEVIAALLADGKRVAITSNSHAAINHLLKAAWTRARAAGTVVKAAVARRDEELTREIDVVDPKLLDSARHALAGGTAWLFCRAAQEQQWDYLFVDEASQVSLADVVAAGQCASNIVLLGDQMQLPQPTQGIHPGDSGLSALDYLMQGHATVPPERGVFLGQTHRMHPDVCRPVSEGVYEGRLASSAPCARQRLLLRPGADTALQPTGVVWLPVQHQDRSQAAPEEAERVATLYASLLQQDWVNQKGETARLGAADILIVAPYNAQVRMLRKRLGEQARVGTVDKFQGQEAAVAILSMTSSDADSMPRGPDFLFSIHRLNVAISRARCLAVLVASPGLNALACSRVEDMPLLNFYSMLVSTAAADLTRG